MTTTKPQSTTETLEPLSDKELEQMRQWAAARIVENQSHDELMKLALKTDAFLQRALQEIVRTRLSPASAAPVVDETFDVKWRRPNTAEVLECHDLTAALLVFRIRAAIRMSGGVELLSVVPKEVGAGISEPSVSNHVFTCSACSRQWSVDSRDALECFFVGLCYWCIRQHQLTKADIDSHLRSLLPAAATAAPVEQCGKRGHRNELNENGICQHVKIAASGTNGPTLICDCSCLLACLKCGHNTINCHGECRQCIDWQRHKCVFVKNAQRCQHCNERIHRSYGWVHTSSNLAICQSSDGLFRATPAYEGAR